MIPNTPAQTYSPHQFLSNAPAALMANGLDVDCLRTNALLSKDEWSELDSKVIGIARDRLAGIADLQNANLIRPLGGLGTIVDLWEKDSDMTPAKSHLSAESDNPENDAVETELEGVPVPITSKVFKIDLRRLEASRKLGGSIDTRQAAIATRRVVDKLEDMLFNGEPTIKIGGYTIPGYRTFTARNTGSGTTWGTVANVDTTIDDMISAAEGDNMFGPYGLYLHSTQFAQLRKYLSTQNDQTIHARVLARPEISFIRPTQAMTAGEALLVQMSPETVELARAVDIKTIQWQSGSGMTSYFMVMAAMVPRLMQDYDGRSGIVHYTGI